jgi:hypothetical protein
MFNFFKDPPSPIEDTADVIYLDQDGDSFFSLECDPMLYAQGLNSIRTILANWIKEDRAIAADTAIGVEGTVSYLLNNIDVKMLPHAIYLDNLLKIITDTEINHGGSRLLDAIVLIHTVVPTEVIETFKGKFLYGMLYGLSNVENKLPTKDMWVYALATVPWIPFIVIIQEIISLESLGNATSSITELVPSDTNVVVQ